MIKADKQAVLNTLTEHDFQDAFKKKKAEEMGTLHTSRSGLVRGRCWLVGPKSVFDQMAAPVLESMDGSLYERSAVAGCFKIAKSFDFCTKKSVPNS
jgi:hypothetical protein